MFCRSLESNLYNKANELQEDISMKRFDLRVAQIHLGAVKAQVSTIPVQADRNLPPLYFVRNCDFTVGTVPSYRYYYDNLRIKCVK